MNKIKIIPLQDKLSDYNVLFEWLCKDSVKEFYNQNVNSLNEVYKKYHDRVINKVDFFTYFIVLNNTKIGYIQYYLIKDKTYFEKEFINYYKDNIYGIDLFIANSNDYNKSYGSYVIKKVIDKIIKKGINDIFIDPLVNNIRAIKCYEKVGFRKIGIMKNHDYYKNLLNDSLLMKYIG